ncbi:glycosyltransferase family 2 protein [Gemmatimonas aurantiaca]|nr:glycosyltransferase family 2 protein [Gemmatimonas aurantiaca]
MSRTSKPVIHFLIPAYNEEDNLPFLFSNLRRIASFLEHEYHVTLVNDCSTDGTSSLAHQASQSQPITVIDFSENRGPGAAFDAAFSSALANSSPHDIFVTIEADNTSDLCILSKMLVRIERGADVVLASVYGSGKVVGAPFSRIVLSFFANLLMKVTLGMPHINTFSSFFRMYRREGIEKTYQMYGNQTITEPGFVCMVELLIKFKRAGLKMVETPMLLDSNIRVGDSKMKIARTTLSYFHVLGKHLFTSAYHPNSDS